MKKIGAVENFYLLLPRFVTESEEIVYIKDKYLPALVREFEWNDLKFTFVITPARVRNENGVERYYYPEHRERIIEAALRQLAVKENINFRSRELTLDFALSQLRSEIDSLDDELAFRLKNDDLELGLRILGDVKYELICGSSELYFRPIEKLVIRGNDEEIYCRAQFSELFFSHTKQFDFCFSS